MKLKGSVTRVYEEDDRNWIHVRPADPDDLRWIDGAARLGSGEIRQEADGDYEVGESCEIEVRSAKDEDETQGGGGARRRTTRRQSETPTE